MMFTPPNKRKPQTDWSLTPHRSGGGGGGGGGLGLVSPNPRIGDRNADKGKAVAFADGAGGGGGEAADWRKFKEAGFLDESLMEKQDREALVQKIVKLEKELHDYQYNMGLLLIEKQNWASTYEELSQAFAEAQETLKREQIAHLMVLSEVEKREENLRKALQNEKQCSTDSDKAFHLICAGSEEMKLTSDRKIAEAHALVTSVEDKSLVVEAKLHAVDAKLAEVSRKGAEIERKLKETETYEHLLLTDRHSLNAEKATTEVTLSKQREELQDWDNNLQEREERQLEGRRTLKQVEERTRDNYSRVEQKEKDLKEAQRKTEILALTLKNNEDDMQTRLASFAKKEEEVKSMQKNLERKEKELLALEEKLIAREGVEIQRLYDEHNATLDLKKHDFELEMDRKRKDVDKELSNRVTVLELKEVQVVLKDETVGKREQALEKKLDNCEMKERDLESKWEALREREKFLQDEEKRLEMEKDHMLIDKDKLKLFDDELDKKRVDLDEKQQQLRKELENLKVTEEERMEIQRLQSELRQKEDKCMLREEFLSKEQEALKQLKEDYEREWEVLDEKKTEITGTLNQIQEEKEKFEKLKQSNEERLKDENLIAQEYIQKELEALRLKKASFEASMERERMELSRKAESERQHMLHDLELQKRQLELDMQSKLDKLENNLLEKEKALKEQMELELKNINQSTEVAGGTMRIMRLERLSIEKETQELATSKQRLEGQQIELRKDADKLNILFKKLKDKSKGFKEFLENHEKCKNCGEDINGYLQFLQDMENIEVFPLSRLSEVCTSAGMKGNALGTERLDEAASFAGCSTSSLLKCTTKDQVGESSLSDEQLNSVAVEGNIRDSEGQLYPSVTEPCNRDFKALEVPEGSLHSELKSVHEKPSIKTRRGGRRANSVKEGVEDAKVKRGRPPKPVEGKQPSGVTDVSADIIEDKEEVSLGGDERPAPDARKKLRSDDSEIATSEQDLNNSEAHSVSVTTRRGRRANTVKAGVEDAKVKHGKLPKQVEGKQPSGNTDVSAGITEGSQEVAFGVDERPAPAPVGRKQLRSNASESATSEQELDNSEAHGVSVTTRRGRKANSGTGVEDAKVKRGKLVKPVVGKQPSGTTNVPAAGISTEDSQEVSLGRDDRPEPVGLKQLRSHAYETTTTSEQELDSSEAHSVGVTTRRGRKRQQTANHGSETPEANRHNLRRRKT